MVKSYLTAFGAGVMSALMFMTPVLNLAFGMLVGPFSSLPLFLVGLWGGVRVLMVAGIVGAVIPGILLQKLLPEMLYYLPLGYAATVLLPAGVMARQALLHRTASDGSTEWYPAGRLLAMLAALISGLYLVASLAFMGVEGGFVGQVAQMVTPFIQSFIDSGQAELDPLITIEELAAGYAFKIVTLTPAGLALGISVCMFIAQGLLTRLGKNLRPSFDLIALELPIWPIFAFGASAALGIFAPAELKAIGTGCAVAFAVPFFFLGLAVIHAFARRFPGGILLLILVYGLLLFLTTWIGPILALVGFLERWLKLRRRGFGLGSGQE
jgi:hypothetical protein